MEEIQHRETEQIAGKRLLHVQRRGIERFGNARETGQIGIDGERAHRRQARQEDGQGPARCAPQAAGFWIHQGSVGAGWGFYGSHDTESP